MKASLKYSLISNSACIIINVRFLNFVINKCLGSSTTEKLQPS